LNYQISRLTRILQHQGITIALTQAGKSAALLYQPVMRAVRLNHSINMGAVKMAKELLNHYLDVDYSGNV